ncbi:MAG: hypothetical protein IPJ27_19550 [Candidatus Accumulibacter sp.]|uniref:Uncharacterized protein n=1 Tax=Candidatus Accumulibacter proximus TaxID=2954385 RepID=A0A935UIP0_9PROT|nr:hypothetical protein [Candidatus Accumulibacter proximus]
MGGCIRRCLVVPPRLRRRKQLVHASIKQVLGGGVSRVLTPLEGSSGWRR